MCVKGRDTQAIGRGRETRRRGAQTPACKLADRRTHGNGHTETNAHTYLYTHSHVHAPAADEAAKGAGAGARVGVDGAAFLITTTTAATQ